MTALEKDSKFQSRIQSAIETVQAWDADPLLLAECRAMIPLDQIMSDESEYCRDDDVYYEGDILLLKRLALYFKEIMTWVNAPPCTKCGSAETKCERVRSAETLEEREGNASRVEVYKCLTCNDGNGVAATFARFNSPRKLLETQQGRCGEYANLFGLYCRSLGFETRYILDVTDHVWTEVYVRGQWIMADSCEGVIGEPSMYEAGWGKKLSFNVGVSVDQVVDVTPRYTRQFSTNDFQTRRREICSSEAVSRNIIQQFNSTLRVGLSKGRVEELNRRAKQEGHLLDQYKTTTKWIKGYREGRTSGSLSWRAARLELGQDGDTESDSPQQADTVKGFHIESFFPPCEHPDKITVKVSSKSNKCHGSIQVEGATCAVEQPDCVSIVVLDEVHLGCILQSRSFHSWLDVGTFVDTLPVDRVVALVGSGKRDKVDFNKMQKRLGGFAVDKEISSPSSAIMFVGMVDRHPEWATCTCSQDTMVINLSISGPSHPSSSRMSKTSLKLEKYTRPKRVAGRLPDEILSLQEQLTATFVQKQQAFLSFASTTNIRHYAGFVTKPNTPVYLIDQSAYPFERDETSEWKTYHFLPNALLENDSQYQRDVQQQEESTDQPKFDVPVDTTVFTSLLGPSLLVHTADNAPPVLLDTQTALHNNRLVALYFSAHWCPPCKKFTPLLAEMYTYLKQEVAPFHGLEIVYVNSDRDASGFQHYFGTMPWLAVPYQGGRMLQQQISAQYGVRGIPALIVLDAMSGQIVVPGAEARSDVTHACHGGDATIESLLKDNWLAKIPAESQEIMQMLELSCAEEIPPEEDAENPYLVRSLEGSPLPPMDPKIRVKEIFDKLVVEGSDPNAAAAKAIQILSLEEKQKFTASHLTSLDKGFLKGEVEMKENDTTTPANERVDSSARRVLELNQHGREALQLVLSTAQKYLANAIREPWTSKFRTFKLSNKVFDRITRIAGSLDLLSRLGFSLYGSEQDFVACIPLSTNLDTMESELTRVMKTYVTDTDNL